MHQKSTPPLRYIISNEFSFWFYCMMARLGCWGGGGKGAANLHNPQLPQEGLPGRHISSSCPKNPQSRNNEDDADDDYTILYIGNLDPKVEKEAVRRFFESKCGVAQPPDFGMPILSDWSKVDQWGPLFGVLGSVHFCSFGGGASYCFILPKSTG